MYIYIYIYTCVCICIHTYILDTLAFFALLIYSRTQNTKTHRGLGFNRGGNNLYAV